MALAKLLSKADCFGVQKWIGSMARQKKDAAVIRLVARNGRGLNQGQQDPEEDPNETDGSPCSPEWFAFEVTPQDGIAEWIRTWHNATRLTRVLLAFIALIMLAVAVSLVIG